MIEICVERTVGGLLVDRVETLVSPHAPGEVVTTVPESQIVETLVTMALEMAEEMGVDPESGEAAPVVSVS